MVRAFSDSKEGDLVEPCKMTFRQLIFIFSKEDPEGQDKVTRQIYKYNVMDRVWTVPFDGTNHNEISFKTLVLHFSVGALIVFRRQLEEID